MKKYSFLFSLFITSIFFFSACSDVPQKKAVVTDESTIQNGSLALLDFFEANGNFINSKKVPTLLGADVVYENLDNYLVIDLRSHSAYVNGHIDGAVNVPIKKLLDYFENKESAAAYERVILVCYSGQTASYATSILRLLGYGNVYAMKWGMSSWNKETAGHWQKNISNKYAGKLETKENAKHAKGDLPVINDKAKTIAELLENRAKSILAQGLKPAKVKVDELFANPEKYYIVNYWPEKHYKIGHVPGAVQYQPKKSLDSKTSLYTLPTNKPIALYCYTGQHAAFAVAYLRMLGYDAKILLYGSNSFMNTKMKDLKIGHAYSNASIKNYPLVEGENPSKKVAVSTSAVKKEVKKKVVKKKKKKAVEEEGGC